MSLRDAQRKAELECLCWGSCVVCSKSRWEASLQNPTVSQTLAVSGVRDVDSLARRNQQLMQENAALRDEVPRLALLQLPFALNPCPRDVRAQRGGVYGSAQVVRLREEIKDLLLFAKVRRGPRRAIVCGCPCQQR